MASCVKIMIVEDEPEIRKGYRSVLEGHSSLSIVYETDSELQALDYLEIHAVDVLVLDIELSEGDGLSLLAELEQRELEKPFVVVVTNTGSRVTLRYMRAHGADYIYQKTNRAYSPAKVVSVIEKIYPYQRVEEDQDSMHAVAVFNQTKADEITMEYIGGELEKMGFRRRNVGFRYTAEAIFILIRDKEERLHLSSDIYPVIAKKYHTTKVGVERGIRNAIETAFTGSRVHELHENYPFPYDEERGRPTNTEFLKNMASRLQI